MGFFSKQPVKPVDEGTKNGTLQLNRMASSTNWRDLVSQNSLNSLGSGSVSHNSINNNQGTLYGGWQQVQLQPAQSIITLGGATHTYQTAGVLGGPPGYVYVTIGPSPKLPKLPKLDFTEEEIEKAMEIING